MGELVRFTNSQTSKADSDYKPEKEFNLHALSNYDLYNKSVYNLLFKELTNLKLSNFRKYFKYNVLDSNKLETVSRDQSNHKEGVYVMDEGYKQLISRLDQDAREREERYERRAKEMEDRVTGMFIESIKKIESKLDNHEKILETKLELMDNKISHIEKQVNDVHDRTRFWVNLIVPSSIAIIVGIVTVLLSFYITG